MSKKKPYSKIENANILRGIARETKKFYATIKPEDECDCRIRMHIEELELREKITKLQDFLYVQDTKESEQVVSAEATALGAAQVKLLKQQLKAMTAYEKALAARIVLVDEAKAKAAK